MSTSGRVSRGGPRQLEEAAEGVGPGASAPRCGRSGVRRAELATIAATQRGRAATCAKRAGAPPSTGTAPAVQLRARPCSTSPSGTVRVSRASVRRVPSTKAIATGAVPHQTAGAPRTPHRPRPDRTRRRAASRPTAGPVGGVRAYDDAVIVRLSRSAAMSRRRSAAFAGHVLGTLLGSGAAASRLDQPVLSLGRRARRSAYPPQQSALRSTTSSTVSGSTCPPGERRAGH